MNMVRRKGIIFVALMLVVHDAYPMNCMRAQVKGFLAGAAVVAALVVGVVAYVVHERHHQIARVNEIMRDANDPQLSQEAIKQKADNLWILLHRTGGDFTYAAVKDTFSRNVHMLPVPHSDPRHAYESARYVLGRDVTGLPSKNIKALLLAHCHDPAVSENDKHIARQLNYVFGSPYLREEYDAYLAGPVAGRAKLYLLRLPEDCRLAMHECFMSLRERQAR